MTTIQISEKSHIYTLFNNFLEDNFKQLSKNQNKETLQKAFNYAYDAHETMKDRSGEPYILRLLSIAKIAVEEMGLGATSASLAVLHDVAFKANRTIDDIQHYFGSELAEMTEALSDIKDTEYFSDNPEASVFRQILLSISNDIRVALIKIAEKLYNLRNIKFLPEDKKKKLVEESTIIYIPISNRLGLYEIKTEMEDICMSFFNPKAYTEIQNKLKISKIESSEFINSFIEPVKKDIDKLNIKYKIKSRYKSIYSIWKKIKRKKVTFEEVYDLFAVRIIYTPRNIDSEKMDAKIIGSIVTNIYKEKKDRTRDWLDIPKDTGYSALHHTVMSDRGKWVEVQIRSENMDKAAEFGLAAHWKYKGLEEGRNKLDSRVKEILEHLSLIGTSATDFMEDLKLNLLTSEIFVFTPHGEMVSLPKGAGLLDFAFKIHTEVGKKTITAKINDKLISSLDTKLKNGDQIEIITSKNQIPKIEWLDYVITSKAISFLKKEFRKEKKEQADRGEKIVEDVFERNNIYNIHEAKHKLAKFLNLSTPTQLFIKVGENKISRTELLKSMNNCCPGRKSKFWKIKIPFRSNDETAKNSLNYETAPCCKPLPGDEIIGVRNIENNKITVHKKDCFSAITELTFNDEILDVKWTSYTAIASLSEFIITGNDSKGIVRKLSSIISDDLSVNIKTLNFKAEKKKFTMRIILFVESQKQNDEIISKIKQAGGVEKIVQL